MTIRPSYTTRWDSPRSRFQNCRLPRSAERSGDSIRREVASRSPYRPTAKHRCGVKLSGCGAIVAVRRCGSETDEIGVSIETSSFSKSVVGVGRLDETSIDSSSPPFEIEGVSIIDIQKHSTHVALRLQLSHLGEVQLYSVSFGERVGFRPFMASDREPELAVVLDR